MIALLNKKNSMKKYIHLRFLSLFLVLASCKSFQTANYDIYSYQQTITLKVEASHLMDKADTSYTDHQDEIEEFQKDMEKIVLYEKNKPNNEITYAMWQLLADKNANLLAGFFQLWKSKDSLSPSFIKESKVQVMEAMDALIVYEGKKNPEAKQNLLNYLRQ